MLAPYRHCFVDKEKSTTGGHATFWKVFRRLSARRYTAKAPLDPLQQLPDLAPWRTLAYSIPHLSLDLFVGAYGSHPYPANRLAQAATQALGINGSKTGRREG